MRANLLWQLTSTCLVHGAFSRSVANSSSSSVKVSWLGGKPAYSTGTTFGLPWPKGQYFYNSTQFTSPDTEIQTWPTAFWADGSLKWTAHALPQSDSLLDQYEITASSGKTTGAAQPGLVLTESSDKITVDTGKVRVSFRRAGPSFISKIQTATGKIVGQNGCLVLTSQTGIYGDGTGTNKSVIDRFRFQSTVDNVTAENVGSVRALVTVRGSHEATGENSAHVAWLPFILRFYLYANSDAIRLVHTLIYDGEASKDFITSIGVRFEVPLAGEELFDRHVRIAGVDGGLLSESVRGLSGLRVDPGSKITGAQFNGTKVPDISTWAKLNSSQLHYIPAFGDYRLAQLSPDGFTLQKRTEADQGWIGIPGGTRSEGLAYLGGATKGGLAVGLRDFWKRYPTGIDISRAASDVGLLTMWIYSPLAQPLDLRPYHSDSGLETGPQQLAALAVTYEDWEPGFNTPYGIARTNELSIYAFDATPSQDHLATLIKHTNDPPVLFAKDPTYIKETQALGDYWAPPDYSNPAAAAIESRLDFLAKFYQDQVEDRRWYGFLDYGDFMHAYDAVRHQWRYDVGGYAWDNSELSPNLFFGNYFLRTGRKDVWRFYEAETRHSSEVDFYHLGKWKGLGTRHGVQHWGDSGKQARISQPQYRKIFYYVSGGDERIGETISDTLDMDRTFLYLDPNRKVRDDNYTQTADNSVGAISLGTDWSSLSASWLLEMERRGPRWHEAQTKLTNSIKGIASLKNQFITGYGLLSPVDGTISPPPGDPNNKGYIFVSHLSAVFGLMEVIDEVSYHYGSDLPEGFEAAFLDYCYYYFATPAQQKARYGGTWSARSLLQGTSRLLAYAASRTGNVTLARKAWAEFFSAGDNGFNESTATWARARVQGSGVLRAVEEAQWLSTNNAANYGLAAIVNLALVGDAIGQANETVGG
ncbi:hypothetical protein Tdes44962_MAKER09028 [Teratosphaeria destructans]|uniref:Uncharacterized protein n=1 Tax=Teratosphaeria destructans TaxID=418781 RepID=A0A9W7W3G9_9PEZI|nr:hypothetical protein Tdes44962_MAKER09028 [Teratosphaeria destructans]